MQLAPIKELTKNRLKVVGQIFRRLLDVVVKRIDRIVLGSNATGRGRRKLALDVVVQGYESTKSK